MKPTALVVAIVLASAVATAAAGDAPPVAGFFGWLEGDWLRETSRGTATESWTRVTPDALEGLVTLESGENRAVTEHLRLERLGEDVFFTAKPRENPLPTAFKLVEAESARLVFENPDHDFPQRILYMREGADGLLVRIEGTIGGESRSAEFRFQRKAPGERPAGPLEQIAWLAGRWRGEAFGGHAEEQWSPASAGTMVGTFRLTVDDRPSLYEFMLVTEEAGSLTLKLKHFNADFTGWEARDEFVSFPLVAITEDGVQFEGLTYRRRGPDAIDVQVTIDKGGEVKTEEFTLRRAVR